MAKPFPVELRHLSDRDRFQVTRMIRRPLVAEHLFYVACYSKTVADLIEWGGPMDILLVYALQHDWDEVVSGDIPGPVKRGFKGTDGQPAENNYVADLVKKIFEPGHEQFLPIGLAFEVKAIVKVADRIDEIFTGAVEWSLGNRVNGQAVLEKGQDMLALALDNLRDIPGIKQDHGITELVAERVNEILTVPFILSNNA